MAERDLDILLQTMQPVLHPGCYCFATLPEGCPLPAARIKASVCEAEGVSVVVDEATAEQYGLPRTYRAAWITLNVYSDLAAVGLTAAFAQALAQAGISCNVVAGTQHDHLFVPYEQKQAAMDALLALQQEAGAA